MPLFSIVMPTRNRAHFLCYSLQTALEQTFDDYEIIVSDNDSSDGTAQVVHDMADRHVRYVCTGKPLSHPDSLEFAANQAVGEYTVFLFDDDALCPDALETIAKVVTPLQVPVVSWDRGFYHHNSWDEAERVNTLELSPFNCETEQLNSRSVLRGAYALSDKAMHGFPLLIDAAFHREIVKRIKGRNSRMFLEFLPEDISFGINILTRVDTFLHLHEILSFFGKHTDSVTYAMSRKNREQRLVTDYTKWDFQHMPFTSVLPSNLMAGTLLKMKEAMPRELEGLELDWRIYFIACYNDLMALQKHGVDVSAELREFSLVIDQQPSQLQTWVRAGISYLTKSHPPFSSQRKLFERFSLLGNLESTLRPIRRRSGNLVIRGKEAGFNNILECARLFNHSLRKELARFWLGQRHSLPVKAHILLEDPRRIV